MQLVAALEQVQVEVFDWSLLLVLAHNCQLKLQESLRAQRVCVEVYVLRVGGVRAVQNLAKDEVDHLGIEIKVYALLLSVQELVCDFCL